MSTRNKENIDYLFKLGVGVAISLAGYFCNRLLNELDEARKDIRQLEITVSNIEGMLKAEHSRASK